MGAKHSLEDDLITFKLTSKQFNRDGMVMSILIRPPKLQLILECPLTYLHIWLPLAKRCDKNEALQRMKLKKAIEQVEILVQLIPNKSRSDRLEGCIYHADWINSLGKQGGRKNLCSKCYQRKKSVFELSAIRIKGRCCCCSPWIRRSYAGEFIIVENPPQLNITLL